MSCRHTQREPLNYSVEDMFSGELRTLPGWRCVSCGAEGLRPERRIVETTEPSPGLPSWADVAQDSNLVSESRVRALQLELFKTWPKR